MTIPASASSPRSARQRCCCEATSSATPRADPLELLGRREAVVGCLGHAGMHLADQAGDAHHEEFVEIVGRDRQEAQPLEQRMGGIAGFLEHAAVEFEPGQFAVDEPLRRGKEAALAALRASSATTSVVSSPFSPHAAPNPPPDLDRRAGSKSPRNRARIV